MPYELMADLVLALHVGYFGFIVLGQAAVMVGWWRGWRWTRNPWLRWIHLAAILLVVYYGVTVGYCPLTRREYDLRLLAGQEPQARSLGGRILQALIYVELPDWMFLPIYSLFALLVIVTMFLYPPRSGRAQKSSISLP